MTNYAKQLTKEYLISLGITKVTEDGNHIYKGDKELKQYCYKDGYKRVQLYDKDLYKLLYPLTKDPASGLIVFGVHRVVYAWFNGIANSEYVIDHKDNNKSNNHIDNLQELTPTQNICKNKVVYQNLKPCNMRKSREFYEEKLMQTKAKYEIAKKLKDIKLVHTLRSNLAYYRDNLRYWDANSKLYDLFNKLSTLTNSLEFEKTIYKTSTEKDIKQKLYIKSLRQQIKDLKQEIKDYKVITNKENE